MLNAAKVLLKNQIAINYFGLIFHLVIFIFLFNEKIKREAYKHKRPRVFSQGG